MKRSDSEVETPAAEARILVVDDEADICEIVSFHLERQGYHTSSASSAEEALRLIKSSVGDNGYDLILLDVMMEGMSGFEMAEELRQEGNQVPIIFLTARSGEEDLLKGFTVGGDDYISKPFSVKELVARVKSVLRRAGATEPEREEPEQIMAGPLVIDERAMTVSDGRQFFEVTKTEYDLLRMLAAAPGRTYTRQEILDRVWSRQSLVLDRTVDVHIARLRKKLGKYGVMLFNRVGFGYGLRPMTLEEIELESEAESDPEEEKSQKKDHKKEHKGKKKKKS